MTPTLCMVKHDPPHTYGDCVRACIATVMNLPCEDVPHFCEDGCNGEIMQQRIRDWLNAQGYFPFWCHFDGSATLHEVLVSINQQNPDATYILYGGTGEGDHVVVCQGAAVVHNPAWVRISLKHAASWGTWTVLVIGLR